MTILLETDHFKIKHDMVYGTDDFDTLLSQRPDTTKEMMNIFTQLMSVVRNQAAPASEQLENMEKGCSSISGWACPIGDKVDEHGNSDGLLLLQNPVDIV
ncbi:hypothetical protein HJFPF1_07381 [Paramyrothecium foliicola]|nr:hypothetical protein HJFPF1_07381 [Paramyrothecium foliicola]